MYKEMVKLQTIKPIGAKEVVKTLGGKTVIVRKFIRKSTSEVDFTPLNELLYDLNPMLRGNIASRKIDVLWPTETGNRKFIDNMFVGLRKVASLVL